jgi:hypothetical protein
MNINIKGQICTRSSGSIKFSRARSVPRAVGCPPLVRWPMKFSPPRAKITARSHDQWNKTGNNIAVQSESAHFQNGIFAIFLRYIVDLNVNCGSGIYFCRLYSVSAIVKLEIKLIRKWKFRNFKILENFLMSNDYKIFKEMKISKLYKGRDYVFLMDSTFYTFLKF